MSNESQISNAMFGAFGQTVEDQVNPIAESGGSKLKQFKPDPSSTASKKWMGVVKFLPNLEDLKNPMVKKTTYWMTDPTTNKGFLYESPKTIGKYEPCIVADSYWKWKESKDARLEAAADKLSYSRKCFVLVQVIKDPQNPENVGQIYLWNLPVKIQKMIDAKRYPTKEEIDMGEVAHNPFDPFTGLTMTLKIGLNEHGRVWDECAWSKDTLPKTMILDGEKTPLVLSQDANELKNQQQKALQTILDSEVKLSEVAYVPADENTLKRTRNVLNLMSGEPVNTDDSATETATTTEEAKPETATTATTATETATTTEEAKPETATTETASEEGDTDFMSEVMGDQ